VGNALGATAFLFVFCLGGPAKAVSPSHSALCTPKRASTALAPNKISPSQRNIHQAALLLYMKARADAGGLGEAVGPPDAPHRGPRGTRWGLGVLRAGPIPCGGAFTWEGAFRRTLPDMLEGVPEVSGWKNYGLAILLWGDPEMARDRYWRYAHEGPN